MASITSVISLFVLLLATYSYSLPVETQSGHGMPIGQQKFGHDNKGHMHLMNDDPNKVPNIQKDGTSAEQDSGENVPKDPMKPMPPKQESDKRYFVQYSLPTISYQTLGSPYFVLRELNETSQNITNDRRAIYYQHLANYVPVTYLDNVYSRYLVVRDLKDIDSSKDPLSKNDTDKRAYILTYPYTTSYVNTLGSSLYFLKREVDGEVKVSMNEIPKNETDKRAFYYTYGSYLPTLTTSYIHDPARVMVLRDLKDIDSKDQLKNETDKRAFYYTYGSYLPALTTSYHIHDPARVMVLRDLKDVDSKDQLKNETDKRAFVLDYGFPSSYMNLYGSSYYLLKREVDGEVKMPMNEPLKNETDKRAIYYTYGSYLPAFTTTYHIHNPARYMVLRDLKDVDSKDQLKNETDKRAYILNTDLGLNVLSSPVYLYARDLKDVDSKDQSSTNKTERAYINLLGSYYLPSTYLSPLTTTYVLRELNDKVPVGESQNKSERAYVLTYPYSSYVNTLGSSLYFLKRDADGELKVSMNEQSKNNTDKRDYIDIYGNYVPTLSTTYLDGTYGQYLTLRDLKDVDSKDQLKNETDKRAYILNTDLGLSLLSSPVYVYARDLKDVDSKDQSSTNKTERAYINLLGSYYLPSTYLSPLTTGYVLRELNETVKVGNKSERAYVLTYPYTTSYVNTLGSSLYFLKRDADGELKVSMNEIPKNETDKRAFYYTYGSYLPTLTTTYQIHNPARYMVLRDLKDVDSKDQLKNETDKRAFVLDYGFPSSYMNYYGSSYYLLKREIDVEGKVPMNEQSKNNTDKRGYIDIFGNYVPTLTTSYIQEPAQILVARELTGEESMQSNKTTADKRAILIDGYPRMLYTTHYTHYTSPLGYVIGKRGSEELGSPIKNEQGVKDESGSSMESSTEFNRRAIKPTEESEEETSSIRPRGMEQNKVLPGPFGNTMIAGQGNDMSGERPNEGPIIKVPGQKQPINKAEEPNN